MAPSICPKNTILENARGEGRRPEPLRERERERERAQAKPEARSAIGEGERSAGGRGHSAQVEAVFCRFFVPTPKGEFLYQSWKFVARLRSTTHWVLVS